ncbi:MAG: ABC transporter permease [Candidatus Hinthialibacter antarcticus]|nr:ABC transporter permease [Candidatus Hinthialibacter antarcticus]
MNAWTLAWRSFQFYWRSQLGVALGAAIGAAVLIGSLLVGSSINETLHQQALSRIGQADFAMQAQERFFRSALADDVQVSFDGVATAPLLRLNASASQPDTKARVNRVQTLGVDERFWSMNGVDPPQLDGDDPGVAINQRMAQNLGVSVGDVVLLRIEKPSILSRDAPLSTASDQTIPYRMTVRTVLSDSQMGRFDLRANQIPPHNAFVSLKWLQERAELYDRANMLLVRANENPGVSFEALNLTLQKKYQLADAELEILDLPETGQVEIRSKRIFIDPPVVDAVKKLSNKSLGVLSYLVNILESTSGARAPYSIVTAVGPLHETAQSPQWAPTNSDAVNINQWLADDLSLQPGDSLEMTYFIFGPMRRLIERSSKFAVGSILPMQSPGADKSLMPEFPGLADQDNCRDWDPGFIINLDAIRDKDEAYWDDYGGAPKAVISLQAGQQIWSNRFGALTGIRIPSSEFSADALDAALRGQVNPASFGFFFQPVRETALNASKQAMDFSGLFIGLSFFLIIAALLLTALLFTFAVEQRGRETGVLLAIGLHPKQIRRFYIVEGLFFSILGSLVGLGIAIVYTKAVLWGLSSVWSGAIASAEVQLYIKPGTVIAGLISSWAVSLIAIYFAVRKQAHTPARELLHAGLDAGAISLTSTKRGWIASLIAALCLIGAVALMFGVQTDSSTEAAGVFFGVGSLMLIGGLAAMRVWLLRQANQTSQGQPSMMQFSLRGASRRPGRSLAVGALLACGSFLVIAVGANRQNPLEGADQRNSGTGGFAVYAETAIPLVHDLNQESGLNEYALTREDVPEMKVVAMRVREGDDASCLNLNRAQTPRLMGVDPSQLSGREAFRFAGVFDGVTINAETSPWTLLNHPFDDGAVPAIVDQTSMMWALGKSLGDTLTYIGADGEPFQVRLVAALDRSILQGNVVIAENHFLEKYPLETGYRALLIDAPFEQRADYAQKMNDYLQDMGIEAIDTVERLAMFNSVEQTYLNIFLALGALGLLLGSAGLGVVVLRNVLERRSEFALLRAIGFRESTVRASLIYEHGALLAFGLLIGAVAGFTAAAPSLNASSNSAPIGAVAGTVIALFLFGFFFTALAARIALRGPFLNALRNE